MDMPIFDLTICRQSRKGFVLEMLCIPKIQEFLIYGRSQCHDFANVSNNYLHKADLLEFLIQNYKIIVK
jgi:hypothetical protein